jgi:hypothetical protein
MYAGSVEYNLKHSQSHMFVTVDSRKIFQCKNSLSQFMMFLHITFHMPISNGSLVIAAKMKAT